MVWVLGLALLVFVARAALQQLTDAWWYQAVGYLGVFARSLSAAVIVGLAGALIVGGSLAVTAWTALRLSPREGTVIESELAMLARVLLARHRRGFVVLMGLLGGLAGAFRLVPETATAQAWWFRTPFGVKDPTFGLDVSFFVFTYPWLRVVTSTLLLTTTSCLVLALTVYFVTGASKAQAVSRSSRFQLGAGFSDGAFRHLCVITALVLVAYGAGSLIDRVSYPVTTNALFTGVSYTDEHARISAHLIIAVIAFVCAAMFLVNALWRRWLNPMVAVVLMLVSGLLLAILYPLALQALYVRPSEPDREAPYMRRHVEATRAAFGIGDVEITEYAAKTTATAGQLKADAEALPGVRLLDPSIVDRTFDQLQQVRGFYRFSSVLDVDRYTVDGKATDVVVAAREIDVAGLPDQNWNNIHTVYTHGYGLVAAYGNRRQPAGEPVWLAHDIPPIGSLEQKSPRIYYGEKQEHFVVVGAREGAQPVELDTPGGGKTVGEQNTTYEGPGVSLSNPLRRLTYAAVLADANLILSDRVHERSQLLYHRTPIERVRRTAPWLTIDSNPYPTLVDGRLVWVVDGYTTSATYPNSQRVNLAEATTDAQSVAKGEAAGSNESVSYLRNAVKATVDAATGEVVLYAWDEADPVLRTWQRVYPGTVRPRDQIPQALLEHLRYPEDLFRVQREVLGRYHQTDPQTWYKQADTWVTPEDPVAARLDAAGKGQKEPAYYLSIRWPGDEKPVYSMTSVFTPRGRSNLAAYMAVNADATSSGYGKLRVLRMSDTQQIAGPGQSFNAMTTDNVVAETLRPYLNQGSAKATFGNLLTIPIGGGLLYVNPVYTTREGESSSSYPALRYVMVRFGESAAIGATLQEALDRVFAGDAGATTHEAPAGTTPTPERGTPGVTSTPAPPSDPAVVKAHLAKASHAFDDAEKALKAGDLATYQKKVDEARAEVQAAEKG